MRGSRSTLRFSGSSSGLHAMLLPSRRSRRESTADAPRGPHRSANARTEPYLLRGSHQLQGRLRASRKGKHDANAACPPPGAGRVFHLDPCCAVVCYRVHAQRSGADGDIRLGHAFTVRRIGKLRGSPLCGDDRTTPPPGVPQNGQGLTRVVSDHKLHCCFVR